MVSFVQKTPHKRFPFYQLVYQTKKSSLNVVLENFLDLVNCLHVFGLLSISHCNGETGNWNVVRQLTYQYGSVILCPVS